ncbi:MAG TPA: glycosyltransferase family 2 protein [Mycobacteriales bacterium]|nr:glycosyltransferase family 2 protein [Mycobacteriales bacterium]
MAHSRHLVTAVLVAHDGQRWLPDVLAAIGAQTRGPQRLVAVDTGSEDGTHQLLIDQLGESAVVDRPRDTGFGAAIQAGLDAFAGAPASPRSAPGGQVRWLWLLHDDSAPEPGALEALLEMAEQAPSADVIGPKCLSWDGRHLIEVGITTDGTGHRDTGLERRELDQGQHDVVRDVLAVGSAGALIREETWTRLGGFDPALPLFRDDLDFGWRAWRSGGRVVVAPGAVIRHAAAMSHGERQPAVGHAGIRRLDRRAALFTVLANTSRTGLIAGAPRLALGSVLRSLGFLLARRPEAALDELIAFTDILTRAVGIARARRARAATATTRRQDIRHLFPGPAARVRAYRDALAALAGEPAPTESTDGAGSPEPTGRRSGTRPSRRRARVVETGPVSEDVEELAGEGARWLRRLLTRPVVLLGFGLTASALVAERHLLGGTLAGGRLLPASGGAGDLWAGYLRGWHDIGLGSTTPAPPYLAVVAVVATLLAGKAWLAVDLVLLGCVPLGGITAFRATRQVTRQTSLRIWAALTWATLPVATGAIAGGRLDVAVSVILLPPLAAGIVRCLRYDPRLIGWRPAFASALGLGVLGAFAPLGYLLVAAVVAIGSVAAAFSGAPGAGPRRGVAGLVVLLIPLGLLAPWTGYVVRHPAVLLAGIGGPDPGARPVLAHQLMLFAPAGSSVSGWWFLPLVLAGIAAFARAGRLAVAGAAWLVALAGLGTAVFLQRVNAGLPAGSSRVWPGVPVAVYAAGVLVAALVAADGVAQRLAGRAFSWRQMVAGVLAGACAVVPVVATLAWCLRGAGRPLGPSPSPATPAFVTVEAAAGQSRILVLTPSPDGSLGYALLPAGDPTSLGAAEVVPRHPDPAGLAAAIATLAAGTGGAALPTLAAADVGFVEVTGAGGDPRVAALVAVIGATPGLSRQSPGVWSVTPTPGPLVVLADGSPSPPVGAARLDGGMVRFPNGPAGRLLVLADSRAAGWTARSGGRSLQPATAYGWAQAFALPATGGAVVIAFHAPARSAWLVAELVLTVITVFLALPVDTLGRRALGEQYPPDAGPGEAG